MVSNKELLAKRLQQNTQKHQHAQKEHINDVKELRRNVQITDIQASPNQPRKLFNQQDIEDLAASIEEIGLLQPIAVRRINDKYELIAGERRLKAHQFLNKNTIEVIIIDASDEEVALLTLAENLKREDLTDYEIYVGLTSLDEELKKNKQKLAKSLGMNREDMYKYLSFEKLPG
ncbi:TPA: ParB/RepB/Spo0J family partition protein, partial [Acinetobacter baumannii]